jgi:putative chitinase
MLTAQILFSTLPGSRLSNIELYFHHLMNSMKEFAIFPSRCEAAFLAQCAHESGLFSAVRENLNYSSHGLLRTFPRYFTLGESEDYARQPQRIANRVYANRMGNGPETSGDGWAFRGRGLIQLTGRNNYTAASRGLGRDLIADPTYLETPEGAARSAAWFWTENRLNVPASRGDIDEVSRLVNAGPRGLLRNVHGLAERRAHYERILRAIEGG